MDVMNVLDLGIIVTVCIPVFNGSEYLEACLTSVITQTHAEIEILIVDDGSTDDSLRIIKQFQAADSRIRLIQNEQNLGLAKNWQHCIVQSRGRWIKFLFQDDVMHPQCLAQMLAACVDNHVAACICGREFLIETTAGASFRRYFTHEVYRLENTFPVPTRLTPQSVAELAKDKLFTNFLGEPITLFFEKALVAKIGSYNADLVQLVDYEFALRLALNTDVFFLPQHLVSFRVHSASESSNQGSSSLKIAKSQFVEPLLMYHEYIFNPHFRKVRHAYGGAGKLFKDAAFFYRAQSVKFDLPRPLAGYLWRHYKGIYLIQAGALALRARQLLARFRA